MKKMLCIVALIASIGANAYAYENGDFQIWNTDVEEVKIAKDVKFFMEQEFRFGENAGEFYYQHYDWGFIFGFDKRLDIGLGYRLVLEKYKHKWREEDQPNATATLKFDLWKFKIDDRNRLEYRHFRFKNDSVRYRNKFSIKLPMDIAKIKVSPYASDEIFISSDSTGFNENRFASGIEFDLTKNVKFDIFYMLKGNRIRGDKWNNTNVLGTKIKIAF
ncbi:MAG: DUF2490 domain-containing protein [Candidatus Omnitrophota bacterium]|nr:DUF2490 domain-containing protein [Candidatus Omnitrophota bacterium]